MNITVGQSSDVGHRLSGLNLLPEGVSEHVILAENRHDLIVLDNLQGPGHDEAEVIDALPCVVQEVARSAETYGTVNINLKRKSCWAYIDSSGAELKHHFKV